VVHFPFVYEYTFIETKNILPCSIYSTLEIGLDLNADKTKNMVMSRYQNAGRTHSMKIDNSSFESVDNFNYLGTTLTNQNSIQEEIKSRLKSGNAWYLSAQNPLSYSMLFKNLSLRYIEIYFFFFFCMGVKLGR
jgi:hypothetical protein